MLNNPSLGATNLRPNPLPPGSSIIAGSELRDSDTWKYAFHNKCKDHRYYEIVEDTLKGRFEHHYLVLADDSGDARAIQPVFFVRQDLIEGVPGKITSILEWVR